jgi:hypothetical protein
MSLTARTFAEPKRSVAWHHVICDDLHFPLRNVRSCAFLLRWNKFNFGVIDNLSPLHNKTSQGQTKKKQFDEEEVIFVNIPW